MRKYFLTLATAVFCSMMGSSLFVSCQKKDTEDNEEYQRGLYSDVIPDDGSNSSKYGITDEDLTPRAKELDVEVAALKAVWKVETGGKGGFLPNEKPKILFEGHIFWQQLRVRGINPQNLVTGNEDILFPKYDKTKYAASGVGEYDRLQKAIKINEDAALASASWGMFQTMGYLYSKCGCKTVQEFVAGMEESELSQLDLFIAFLKSNSYMVKALHDHDWVTFAKLYNGPTYAENKYDTKLAVAYSSYKSN
jgi:hypothetical protein